MDIEGEIIERAMEGRYVIGSLGRVMREWNVSIFKAEVCSHFNKIT